MGKRLDEITPELADFIAAQSVFFVATAPLAADGHVNLSPKGLDTFRVLSPRHVAYLDLTGSGNETAAHVWQNGRLTLMFCAFEGRPLIVRLYCKGRVVVRGDDDWSDLSSRFPAHPGARQVIVGDVEIVLTSCGHGVPTMSLVETRDTLTRWAESKGADGLRRYREDKNARSLDAIAAPRTDVISEHVADDDSALVTKDGD